MPTAKSRDSIIIPVDLRPLLVARAREWGLSMGALLVALAWFGMAVLDEEDDEDLLRYLRRVKRGPRRGRHSGEIPEP